MRLIPLPCFSTKQLENTNFREFIRPSIYTYILTYPEEEDNMKKHKNEALVDEITSSIDPAEKNRLMTELYQNNYGYIKKLCIRFSAYEDIDDLLQEAFFGLRDAVARYDPEQEVPFMSFASIMISQTIIKYIDNCGHVLRLPRWLLKNLIKYNKAVDAFNLEHGREPDNNELANILSLSDKQINLLKNSTVLEKIASLDVVISENDDSITLLDSIPDSKDYYKDVSDQIDYDNMRKMIWDEVSNLKCNEAEVIKAYFAEGRSLDDIGHERGCSNENVRQIRDRALLKLRTSKNIQEIAEAVLDAETKLGELTSCMKKAQGFASIRRTDATNVKTKTEQLAEIGISKDQASRFETLAAHPEQVEKAKADARAKGKVVSFKQYCQGMTDKIMKELTM